MLYIPDDVLWHIFCLNAPKHPQFYSSSNRDIYPASGCMETARSTSQVCGRWRRIILSSSAIWSKIIDLSCLSTYTEPHLWLSEVIGKRSKSQNLHLYGGVMTSKGLEAFLKIVQLNWRRIEAIQVTNFVSAARAGERLVHHPAWKTMQEDSSPSLRYFNLQGSESVLEGRGQVRMTLSPNNPNIRFLYATAANPLSYQPQAPIYKNLRGLSLHNGSMFDPEEEHDDDTEYQTFPWSIKQLFHALQNAPLLEVLAVHYQVVYESSLPLQYQDLPALSLPHLYSLNLFGDISVCLATLLRVVPSSTCALRMTVVISDDREWPVAWLVVLQEVIWKQYAPRTTFSSRLSLGLDKNTPRLYSTTRANNVFTLRFIANFEDGTYLSFLNFVSHEAFNFSQVTSLQLSLPSYGDLGHISPSALHSVLEKLVNVESLECNWEVFNLLFEKIIVKSHDLEIDGPSSTQSRSSLPHASLLPNLRELKLSERNHGRTVGGDPSSYNTNNTTH